MKSPKPPTQKCSKVCCQQIQNFSPEMGPYGSIGARIKTGQSHVGQGHFQTTPDPDPKKCHGMTKTPQKVKNILELAKEWKPTCARRSDWPIGR